MKSKKAFTIVELVIVIAVIAILAAVLIPTFSNIIQKSKVSSDQQLIRNLNSALITDAAVNGKHANMQSALDTAFEYGYDVAKIEAKATGNKILWDQVNDVFCYLDGDKVAYIPQSVETGLQANDYRLWVISDKVDANYSTYYVGTAASVDTTKGFDAGKSAVTAINYSTTANQSVIIRTNGGTLTINAANSTVSHYGEGTVLTIDAVASASYHEFGSFNMAEIKKGRLVVESTGSIDVLDASGATEVVTVEVVNKKAIANYITANNANVTVPANANKVEKTEVSNITELQEALDSGIRYIVLTADISGVSSPINVTKSVILDGAGHTIEASTANRLIWIDDNGVELVLNNLILDGKNTCERGVQVNVLDSGEWNKASVTINKCEIKNVTHYAINFCSKTSVDLTINDSTISGWAAINAYGTGNKIVVKNSVLEGINDKGLSDWNNFCTICLEGDTTGHTDAHSSDYEIIIANTKIIAKQTTGNKQCILGFNNNAMNSSVTLNNIVFEIGDGCYFGYDKGVEGTNTLYINDEKVDMPHGVFYNID